MNPRPILLALVISVVGFWGPLSWTIYELATRSSEDGRATAPTDRLHLRECA
jgi:hypothetical protein